MPPVRCGASCAPVPTPTISDSTAAQGHSRVIWFIDLTASDSEVDGRVQPNEPTEKNRRRPRPVRCKRCVVRQPRVVVEDVVDIDAQERSRAPEAQVLGDPQIELVDPISIQL